MLFLAPNYYNGDEPENNTCCKLTLISRKDYQFGDIATVLGIYPH